VPRGYAVYALYRADPEIVRIAHQMCSYGTRLVPGIEAPLQFFSLLLARAGLFGFEISLSSCGNRTRCAPHARELPPYDYDEGGDEGGEQAQD